LIVPAVLYAVACVAFVVFLIVYWTRTRWTSRPEGWHLSATVLALVANCGLAASVIVWGLYPGVQIARTIAASAIAAVAVGMVVSLVVVQRRARRRGR
jgi:hypothetical protein